MKARSGWGFSGVDGKIDLSHKTQKKAQAIWEQAEVNVITVPEVDLAEGITADVSAPPSLVTGKVQDFIKLQVNTRKTTLPVTQDGVVLDDLISIMRANEQVQEGDQVWQFSKLKTQVYEIVSQMYKTGR